LVEDRDNFQRAMKERGVMTSQVHERNDLHPCVKQFKTELPNIEKVIGKLSSLPVGWWVTDEDREYIVEQIKKGW
jgi:dTDP-4-amino-4,6-dideoxygalactose transaminase